MSVFLELRFDRNLNIYKVSSFKDFQMFHLFPNHFSGKLFDYSLLLKNDQYWKTFWWYMWQYLKKKAIFSSSQLWRNKVLYLTSNYIFLVFQVIVSYLNHQHIKNNLRIYNLSMFIKKWIPVVPCFRFFLITELKKMRNISFLCDFQIMAL